MLEGVIGVGATIYSAPSKNGSINNKVSWVCDRSQTINYNVYCMHEWIK